MDLSKINWKDPQTAALGVKYLISAGVMFGFFNMTDGSKLEGILAAMAVAIVGLVMNGLALFHFTRTQTAAPPPAGVVVDVDSTSQPGSSGITLPFLFALALWLVASPVQAQPPRPPVVTTKQQPTCLFFNFQRPPAPQQTDPAVLALLRTIADNQQQILLLLNRQAAPAPLAPAPAPAPQTVPIVREYHYLIPSPGAPIIQIPAPGEPKIVIPSPGDPKIVLPAPGPPKIVLPDPGVPKIVIPPPSDPKITPMGPAQDFQRFTVQPTWQPVPPVATHALAKPVKE